MQLRVGVVDRRLERRPSRCSARRRRSSPSRSATPASASRRRSSGSSSRRSSRPTPARPQVRRHRPRPRDQPRAGAAARRRDPAAEHRRARAARSRCTCRSLTSGRRDARRRRAPDAPAARRAAPAGRRCRAPRDRAGAGRPRGHPARRRRAADRRGRPALRAGAAGPARDQGFKGIVAAPAPRRCRWRAEYPPTAITLDVFLPDMLGWTVLNNLKLDPATRHIPVQMLSVEEERQHGLAHGAFSYLVKPATTEDLETALRPHQVLRRAAHEAAAGRRGQRHRADEHRRAARRTTTSRSPRPAPAPRR